MAKGEKVKGAPPVAPKAATERTPQPGHALLAAPARYTGLTLAGVTYMVDDGVIEVPDEHVARLLERGFTHLTSA